MSLVVVLNHNADLRPSMFTLVDRNKMRYFVIGIHIEIEDLGDIQLFDKKIIPAKIQAINKLNDTVIEVSLRLPPNSNFGYNSGQYVNITKGSIKSKTKILFFRSPHIFPLMFLKN